MIAEDGWLVPASMGGSGSFNVPAGTVGQESGTVPPLQTGQKLRLTITPNIPTDAKPYLLFQSLIGLNTFDVP
jgi:hypothetical protein